MNRIGGSTPGKAIFGLVVVSCDRIEEVGNGLIRVIPANNIGIYRYSVINYYDFYYYFILLSLSAHLNFCSLLLLGHY
jgi:hypothetical protein